MAVKSVVAAGLIIFRRVSNDLEYLLLKASYGEFHWSPPKGQYCFAQFVLIVCFGSYDIGYVYLLIRVYVFVGFVCYT